MSLNVITMFCTSLRGNAEYHSLKLFLLVLTKNSNWQKLQQLFYVHAPMCATSSFRARLLVTPWRVLLLVQGDQHFKIAVDMVVVNDHITSPVAAVGYAFTLYYVYNIEYLKEMGLTLEFVQR